MFSCKYANSISWHFDKKVCTIGESNVMWRKVVYPKRNGELIDYGDLYLVNEEGVVIVNVSRNKWKRGHIMKQRIVKNYVQVHLQGGYRLLSRIVAYAFPDICGEAIPSFDVDHKDNNTLNNHASNLCWLSHESNNGKQHHRDKISSYFKGKPKSIEHRKKIGEGNKGKIMSPEARRKISLARLRKVNPGT